MCRSRHRPTSLETLDHTLFANNCCCSLIPMPSEYEAGCIFEFPCTMCWPRALRPHRVSCGCSILATISITILPFVLLSMTQSSHHLLLKALLCPHEHQVLSIKRCFKVLYIVFPFSRSSALSTHPLLWPTSSRDRHFEIPNA